ncbi:MAG: NTP transferase domain-containing protein [Candidatus Altiarchaeota archaeon]|nr:NTP transferase domain-containing protein [Candidatus Altiarchaeota archaeon]
MDAIVLAAGEGKRLRPLTSTRPKPMLPVAGKPILEWDLEALSKAGLSRAVIVAGYRKESIMDFFGGKFKGMKLEYVEQKEQLGTAHAVSIAKDSIRGDFLVMNGDLIVSAELIRRFLKDHEKSGSVNSMCLVKVSDPGQFGVVELSGPNVKKITEKPARPKSNLVNAGIYLFNRGIFDLITKVEKSLRMEYELTDAIETMIPGKKICGFPAAGTWIDIGRPWDIITANEAVLKETKLKKDKDAVIEKYAVIKGPVHIGKGTLIRSGSYIEGPCFIGEKCNIGPNCHIRAHTSLGDNVHIGNAVEIKNSIIMSKTNIGHLSYVGDSIIGENCNFGAGTKVANLRVDNDEVRIFVKDTLTKSGRRKFGCLMGDDVKTGINVSIMPGRSIYPGSRIEAGSVVRNTIYTE